MSRYVVNLYDRAGCYRSLPVDGFAGAIAAAHTSAANYPDKVVMAFNLEQTDSDFDGLTNEERDSISDAVAGGRRLAIARGTHVP